MYSLIPLSCLDVLWNMRKQFLNMRTSNFFLYTYTVAVRIVCDNINAVCSLCLLLLDMYLRQEANRPAKAE